MADSNSTNAVVYDSRRPGNPNADLGAPAAAQAPAADTSKPSNGVKSSSKTSKPRLTTAEREPLVAKPKDAGRAQKEAALKHKLRTYEMFKALGNGYLPSTAQVGAWSRYLLKSSAVLDSRNRKLSASGRTFIKDVRAWVDAVTDLSEEKNMDDKIQDFIWHTTHAQVNTKVPNVGNASTKIKAGADTDARKAMERLRLLGSLLYGSPEFRKLLSDVSILARDIFADAASNAASNLTSAAEKTRPSESELANIDKSAEDASGGTAKNTEKSAEVPSEGEAKDQVKGKSEDLKKKGKGYAEQAKKKGYESRDEIESYLRQKFPKQRQDAVISRIKKIINDIQKDPDYSESINFLLELAKKYIQRIKEAALEKGEQAKESAEEADVETNDEFDLAMQKGNEILVTFANGKTLDGIQDSLKSVSEDIKNDDDLSEFYSDVSDFLNRALTDKDYITSDSADNEAHRLYEKARDLYSTKQDEYRPDVEHLFDEVKDYADAIQNDKANARVLEAGKKVWSDLVVVRANGQVTIKRRVLRDLADIVIPKLVSEIRYIPVPRIEYQDKDIDLILENLVLESDNFLPGRILFEASQSAEFTNGWSFTSAYSATTKVNIENFSLFIKDASFVIRKKTGLIPFSDRGFFDILMDGPGASAEVILETNAHSADHEDADEDDRESFFSVQSVKVKINRFSYNYHAYHSWGAAILRPIIRPVIRKVLSSLLEQKIREGLESLDKELYAMSERARVATIASGGKGSMESWIRAVTSRPESTRRRAPRSDQFEVTIGETELFPDEHGPGAVLPQLQAAEERVAHESEDTWRSRIFDVRG